MQLVPIRVCDKLFVGRKVQAYQQHHHHAFDEQLSNKVLAMMMDVSPYNSSIFQLYAANLSHNFHYLCKFEVNQSFVDGCKNKVKQNLKKLTNNRCIVNYLLHFDHHHHRGMHCNSRFVWHVNKRAEMCIKGLRILKMMMMVVVMMQTQQ